jgi:hypothetical protein
MHRLGGLAAQAADGGPVMVFRAFRDGVAGRADPPERQLAEALKVRACGRCGLSFGGGEGAFVQHLEDAGRDGTRCLPVHVFESVLVEVAGIWYACGSEPRPVKG